MRSLLLACLWALCLPVTANAKGTITIVPPSAAKPGSYVFVTVRTTFMKHIRMYVDRSYHGRRDLPGAKLGSRVDTTWYVRFPQIATKAGQWEIKVVGVDSTEETVETKTSVSPTVFRDVSIKLDVLAPMNVAAPRPEAYVAETLRGATDPDHTIQLSFSVSGSILEGGQAVTITAKVFDKESKQIEGLQPAIRVTGGKLKDVKQKGKVTAFTWISPTRPGRYRVSAHFRDGLTQTFFDVAKSVTLKVTSWGLHQLRVSGGRFAQTVRRIDPNVRPTTRINALLLPADKNSMLTITVEGLDNAGAVHKTEDLVINVTTPR